VSILSAPNVTAAAATNSRDRDLIDCVGSDQGHAATAAKANDAETRSPMREGWAMPQISASDAAAQQFEDISYPQGLGCCLGSLKRLVAIR